MVAYDKKGQVMSETKRKNFSGQYKAKVALEAIRGGQDGNEIAQEFVGRIRPRWGCGRRLCKNGRQAYSMPSATLSR